VSSAEPDGSSLRPEDVPDSLRVAPPAAAKTPAFRVFQLLSSLVLVVACFVAVDTRSVIERLRAIEPLWLLAAFALHLTQLALLALRWTVVARALGLPLGFRQALGEYALSVFVNQVLPGGIAGDGLRAVRHARRAPGASVLRSVEALAIDRASGQVAFWLAVLASAPLAVTQRVVEPEPLLAFTAALLIFGGIAWYLLDRHGPARGPLERARRSLRRIARVLLHPRNVVLHLPLSLAFVATTLLQLQVASEAIGAPLELAQLVWLGPLILTAASIPSFLGGWGIREGASAVLFGAAGLSGSRGVAVSVVYGVFGLVVSVAGLAVYWLAERRDADRGPRLTYRR
jgi:uncharacterized membrane protein YbhN (UPF0104 family)